MDELKPEEQARVLIDEMLAAAGWAVVPREPIISFIWTVKRLAFWKQNV